MNSKIKARIKSILKRWKTDKICCGYYRCSVKYSEDECRKCFHDYAISKGLLENEIIME